MKMEEKDLSKLGIEIIKDLSEREKRFVSNFIANKLTDKYPYLKIGYFDIFSILYNTPMYVCRSPEEISSVNYLYQNFSIYFSETNDIFDIDEFTLHECIHRIQDKRNKAGRLMQIGICEFTDTKIKGLTFNEAAVQYIVANMLGKERKEINVYNVTINTISDTYYPLITNLIEQIVLLIGEKTLVQSTICGDNEFNYETIDYLGESNFYNIRDNFDKILELKENINDENREDIVNQIGEIYYATQKIIYTSYFNRIISHINKIDEVNMVRQQLYAYAKLIFSSERFNEYKEFYNEKIIKLKEIENNLKDKYALMVTNGNIFYRFFIRLKRLFYRKISGESAK